MSCRRIQKAFGDRMVLSDIDLDITQGDRIALVGRNGAGKSTWPIYSPVQWIMIMGPLLAAARSLVSAICDKRRQNLSCL